MATVAANKLELLQIADAVAREKMIDPGLVIEALEESYSKAAKARYGADYDIRASINRKTGDLTMTRVRTVVEEVEDHFTEIDLHDARDVDPSAQIGTELTDLLPHMDFSRIGAQSPSRSSCSVCVRLSVSVSTTNSKTARARSLTVWSSGQSTATSSSTWAVVRQ